MLTEWHAFPFVTFLKFHSARWLFIVFVCAFTMNLYAQNCGCPEYYRYQNEWNNSDKKSSTFIEQLRSSDNTVCRARALEWTADDFQEAGEFDSAAFYYSQAEAAYKALACNDSVLISTYTSWAQLYYTQSEFAKCQQVTLKMVEAAENAGRIFDQALGYTMIAQLLNQTEQAAKGIIYTRKAALLVDDLENPDEQINILSKLSKRYLWHFQDTQTQTSLDSSELYSYRLLNLARSTNRRQSISLAYNNLQGVAYEKHDIPKAIALLDSAIKYTDADNSANMGVNFFDKADLFIEIKKYPEAAQMADSALYYYQLENLPSYTADCYELISRISLLQGNYQRAFEYKELARTITDSIRNVEKTAEVTELERKYNQATNEKTIKELNQEAEISDLNIQLLSAGIAAAVLAILLVVIFFRQSVLKNKQELLEAEQRLNRARMNPHFFFNTLNALQTSALKDKDTEKVAELLAMYAKIMRTTLESTYDDFVTVESEMEYLEMYLSLQQFRCNGSFTYSVQADADVEIDALRLPGMLIQPFVENAIEHGFAGNKQQGKIEINFSVRNNMLHISVSDNGSGIQHTTDSTRRHKSRATEITRDRLFLLNRKYKTKAGFDMSARDQTTGTKFEIHLPIL